MSGITILAFDCAAGACDVAIARTSDAGVTILAQQRRAMQRGQAAALVPMIEASLARAGVGARDLGLVATTIGPGSFTGVRIGLATARGLALALDVPLAGVTTIEALLAAATNRRAAPHRGRRLLAAIDSHRGDYYVGFEDAPMPFVADAAAIGARLGADAALIAGDGAASLCAVLGRAGLEAIAVEETTSVDAAVLARLAARRSVAHWRDANRREGMPRPLYLRPAAVSVAADGR
jgi:tRNA threonylcarbamoyladenosine biosynthesis protein TsaB